MSRNNVTVVKSSGGLGRNQPNEDMVCGLVMNGIAVIGGVQLGVVYPLKGVRDLEALKIDLAYDDTNSVLVFHHIDRFFKRNPDGELHIMLVVQTVTLTQMCDKANLYAKKLSKDLAGRIKAIGIARNPVTAYAPVLTEGLDSDVLTAITKAQELFNDEFAKFRYAEFLIEGRSFNGTATAAKDLRTMASENVSLTIASDPAVSTAKAIYNGYAAIGDVLGLISRAAVSQNVGELIQEFNLTDVANNVFVTAGLSSNLNVNSYADEDLDTLHDKGYIFPEAVAGLNGFYLNDSHTATLISSDFAYLENNRTIHKAIRLARIALLPKVKSRLKVDPTTGQIIPVERKALENTAIASLNGMLNEGDISGGVDAYINPEQNILSTSQFVVELTFIPTAIGRKITLKVGFKNPFKN